MNPTLDQLDALYAKQRAATSAALSLLERGDPVLDLMFAAETDLRERVARAAKEAAGG